MANLELRRLIALPPELFLALGEVTARYGQIEHILVMTIHRTAKLSYADSYEWVRNILRGKNKDVCREAKSSFKKWAITEFGEKEGGRRSGQFDHLIESWIAEDGLANRRHDVVHCCWSIKDHQVRVTRKGDSLDIDGHPAGTEDVKKLANNLSQFVVRLNTETLPQETSGPEEVLKSLPNKFSYDYVMPPGIETSSTCVSTAEIAFGVGSPKPSGE